jgi:hypothetical protein
MCSNLGMHFPYFSYANLSRIRWIFLSFNYSRNYRFYFARFY